jgi:hypothetical protein
LLGGVLDAIESDKEGEDLLTSSLQKKQSIRKANAELFENIDTMAFDDKKNKEVLQHISDVEDVNLEEESEDRDSSDTNTNRLLEEMKSNIDTIRRLVKGNNGRFGNTPSFHIRKKSKYQLD